MEARLVRALWVIVLLSAMGASYRTPNFVVQAPSARFAKQTGEMAEKYRRELAVLWLGKPLPKWAQPCPIRLQVGPHLGAGGATSFVFDHGQVFGWQMTIQGSEERILDSVLPHEVTHTIFATHFRRPLPRWADEGACTTVEHPSEQAKQQRMLIQFLQTDRGISFSKMVRMKEYPHDILPLYSEGYSLARFLIEQWGRRKYITFLADGMADDQWDRAFRQHYGYQGLAELQIAWLSWVRQGSPRLAMRTPEKASATLVADNHQTPPVGKLVYRGQDPERSEAAKQRAALASKNSAALATTPNRGVWKSRSDETATPGNDALPSAKQRMLANSRVEPIAGRHAGQSSMTQVTRPQPYQQPRQIILQRDGKSPGGRAAGPTSAASRSQPSRERREFDASMPHAGVIRR